MKKLIVLFTVSAAAAFGLTGCAALETIDAGSWIAAHASALGNLFSSSRTSGAADASGKTTEDSAK